MKHMARSITSLIIIGFIMPMFGMGMGYVHPDDLVEAEHIALATAISRSEFEHKAKSEAAQINRGTQPMAQYIFPAHGAQYLDESPPRSVRVKANTAPSVAVRQPVQEGDIVLLDDPAIPLFHEPRQQPHWFTRNWRVFVAVATVAALGAWWFFKRK